MSEEALILDEDNWFIGEDKTFRFIIRTGKQITATAAANVGATVIAVERLNEALLSGDKVYFPDNETTVTLSGAAAIGDASLAVDATPGDVDAGEIGKKIQNILGYTFEFIMRRRPGEPTADITKTTGAGTISIIDAPGGIVEVNIVDTDTDSLAPLTYFYTLRRTDAGSETVFSFGEAVLKLATAP